MKEYTGDRIRNVAIVGHGYRSLTVSFGSNFQNVQGRRRGYHH
jgi:hypothetical protein